MTPCSLSSSPPDCFAQYQNSHLQKRNRHSWESIGECDGCKYARINAEIAFKPEPDEIPPRSNAKQIDPTDFEIPAAKTETRGAKKQEKCKFGHNEWGWQGNGIHRKRYCKHCNRLRVNRQRNGGRRAV